jgi:hypothetical protein
MHSPPDEQAGTQPQAEDGPPTQSSGQTAAAAAAAAAATGTAGAGAAPTAAPPPDRPDYKAVARISTQATLERIQLAFLHANMRPGIEPPADWTKQERTASNTSAELDRDALRLIVHCEFATVWAPGLTEDSPAPATNDAPFALQARFRIEYALKNLDGIDAGDEQHFARTNGVLHAWPYWREIAQNTTLRMGIVPLLVGTFKIPWSGDPGREQKTPAPAAGDPQGEIVLEATSVEVQASDEKTTDM